MKLKMALMAAVIMPAVLAGCDTTPSRPHMSEPVASEAVHASTSRARIRDLRAEVRGQVSYLKSHLGQDRSYILDMGDSLLVSLPGAGAFDGRSDRLTAAGIDQIERIAASMKAYPHTRVTVIGHVEASRSDYADKILSDRRAVMVKSVLERSGVDACRLGVLGKGSTDPISAAHSNRNDQYNSRIEIMIKPMQDGACT